MIKTKDTFYVLGNDIIFKNTFNTEERLKRLLSESLDLKVNEVYQNDIELPVENVKERVKKLDLILNTDKGIINVEVNYNSKSEVPNRNFLFFCKLISSSIKKTEDYTTVEKHIQLNLTWNLQKFLPFDVTNRKIIKCYIMDEETHQKVHDDIFEIVHVNMDYFKKVWYHGNIKDENPFFMLLAASNKEELDKISKGDRFMEEISKKVKKLNLDPEIVKEIVIENEDEIIKNSIYHNGIKEGISQGIKEGISQGKIEIAKNLLKKNIDINIIAETTGLSLEEINALKEQKQTK